MFEMPMFYIVTYKNKAKNTFIFNVETASNKYIACIMYIGFYLN